MSNKNDNKIKPHTKKKFELMERYIESWARTILGYKKSKGLIYVDCMCNSGIYWDEQDNKVLGTAIRAARILNIIASSYPQKSIYMFFNDKDPERVKMLENYIRGMNIKKVKIQYSNEDVADFLSHFHMKEYSDYQTLLFYDPYDANINWSAIKPFLNTWGEVIINHMVSDIKRGISQVKNVQKIKQYEQTYETTMDDLLNNDLSKTDLEKIIEKLILKYSNSNRERYIAVAPFYIRSKQRIYNIIHYSNNIRGYILFKECVWKTFNGRSSNKPNDKIVGQLSLLDDDTSDDIIIDNDHDIVYNYDDIARYIYQKYNSKKKVLWKDIYKDLERHPVFPSEGIRNDIRKAIKRIYPNKVIISSQYIEFRGIQYE